MNLCAEVMAYSSVVGSGVLIVGNKGKGPMVGQIAYLCHTDTLRDKGLQIAMSEAIAKALNELFAARQAPADVPTRGNEMTARQIIEARLGRPLGSVATMPQDLRRALYLLALQLVRKT